MSTGRGAIRLAVVGLGYWGPNLVRVLADRADVEVRWLCDQDPARIDQLRRRYPAARGTTDLDDVLADPAVDAVVLATPVFTHFELGRRCLEAGKQRRFPQPHADIQGHGHQQG